MRLATLGTVKGVGEKLSTSLRLLQMKEGAPLSKVILKHLSFLM